MPEINKVYTDSIYSYMAPCIQQWTENINTGIIRVTGYLVSKKTFPYSKQTTAFSFVTCDLRSFKLHSTLQW
jgi:hypothetical protein